MSARRHAPAALRNREHILKFLMSQASVKSQLQEGSVILEIAAGSGEHASYMAPHFPTNKWLCTDLETSALDSIASWNEDNPNVLKPETLDVCKPEWGDTVEDFGNQGKIGLICNCNMIHISPWECTPALFRGAQRLLRSGQLLYLYGPFSRGGKHTAPSNEAFSERLKSRNPEWGVRDLDAVTAVASAHEMDLVNVEDMPANNLSVLFQRR